MNTIMTIDQKALLIHLLNEIERKQIPLKEFIEKLEAMKNEHLSI